jgi:peptidoglycan/LPS O-acetylase OafA/YrhL
MRHLHALVNSPILIPRWLVALTNALFVVLGVALIVAGSPSVDLSTPHGYLLPYGALMTGFAVLALFGSAMNKPWAETIETIGSLGVFCLLTVFVASTGGPALKGDANRAALAVVVLICSILAAWRGFSLLFAAIRIRAASRE